MLTTASVKTDFAGSAKIGDWVEAHVDVHEVGGQFARATDGLSRGRATPVARSLSMQAKTARLESRAPSYANAAVSVRWKWTMALSKWPKVKASLAPLPSPRWIA